MNRWRWLTYVGTLLLVFDIFTPSFLLIEGYWDHQYVETYRGYDIHYFGYINVYGVIPEGQDPPPPGGDPPWQFSGSHDQAKTLINSLTQDPIYKETYNQFDLYEEPGYGRYYGIHVTTGEETSRWSTLKALKEYIDGPQGYFTVNDIKIETVDQKVILDTRTLQVEFICTDKPDYVQEIVITVKKDGEVVTTKSLTKAGTSKWAGTVELPSDGTFEVLGDVIHYTGRTRLLSISGEKASVMALPISYLGVGGASMAVLGLIMERRSEEE